MGTKYCIKLPRKHFLPDKISQFFESAYLQVRLEAEGVELVHIDDFSFNTRKQTFRGWVKKGQNWILNQLTEDTSVSCADSFPRKPIYGVQVQGEL